MNSCPNAIAAAIAKTPPATCWFVFSIPIEQSSERQPVVSKPIIANPGTAEDLLFSFGMGLVGITSVLSERPFKLADQKTERGKILNPEYNIFRD